jgi:glucose/arabinose dehydrogenase
LLAGFILFKSLTFTNAANLPPGFAEILIAQNLDPTAMALSPDGRLFITEKNGRVLIVDNGQLLPDPFLTLEVDNYNERGLSGIAFDPDFENNHYLYLYYTVKNENHNRVSRFIADGNYVLPGSETILLNIDLLSGTIHNAGSMSFGPDGKLYISCGNGANDAASQSLNSLLGKVLRINADGTVPSDNPFYNQTTGIYRAIFVTGLRNSFSMAIQPVTGRIFATEVGSSEWEEVNEFLPGRNYGWPIIEGPINGQTPPANYKEPVFSYSHANGCAAVGAAFYNPATAMFPSNYIGKFFFADYCDGYIKYMDPDIPGVANIFAENINRPLNMLVAPDGTMYYLARAGLGGGSEEDNTATNNGTLWRIFYTGSGKPFVSVNPQSILVSQGEDARFFIAASGNQPLHYQWQHNDEDIAGANSPEYIFLNAMLSDSGALFRCIISNADGADTTTEAHLSVTADQRPQAEIFTPVEGTTYRAGDTIFYSGHANDPEDGELLPDALKWKIDFHHHTHTHPGLIPTSGITEGLYVIPNSGETSDDVWYEINLSATDSRGLFSTAHREVFPVKTQFHVQTIPDGLPVYVDGDFLHSPVSISSVVGMTRRVEVLASVTVGDSIRLFREWTDGATDAVRTFSASDDTITYTAIYDTYHLGAGTGIRGYYYDGPEFDPTFYEPFKFTWIDPEIDFDWGDGSPALTQLGNDFWLVRWEGYVQPLINDTYDFHVIADDGIRLWVDDQMLIDAWIPQPPTEWTGTIALEAGKQYPIKLEFFEEGGGALCRLYWSSGHLAKSIIPQSQLFPEQTTSTQPNNNNLPIKLYPNPAGDILFMELPEQWNGVMDIEIYNILGQTVLTKKRDAQSKLIRIDLKDWAKGIYSLKYRIGNEISGTKEFVKE